MTPRTDSTRIVAAAAAFLVTLATAVPLAALTEEVQITLPVRARLDLSGHSSIALAPCIMVSREREGNVTGSDVDIQGDFERYLRKLLRRETDLRMVQVGPLDYPTHDLERLGQDRDFWRALGERTQADLILSCSLDFDVLARSGYRNESYTSPVDGQTHQRQTLVEKAGFEYDIVLRVYDGRSGELLVADNFKDFQESNPDSEEPLAGMFENLYAVEDRIAGIFSQGKIEASRVLFLDLAATEGAP
ncbi:MAG: hypothetical protein GY719_20940 [bacterium]|nr:hypothetical protein [bacterium]